MENRVADSKDIIIVKRNGTNKNVALIAETDLSSLLETVYLLRSPANATRLHRAIDRAKQRDLQGYRPSEPENSSQSLAQPYRQVIAIEEHLYSLSKLWLVGVGVASALAEAYRR